MYWLIENQDGPVNIIPGDLPQPDGSILIEEDDPRVDFFKLSTIKLEKINEVKNEGLIRIQAIMPAISDFYILDLIREIWLSILPASRSATTEFQAIINIYQAGREAIILIEAMTDKSIIENYNPISDPNWPV